MKQLIPIFSIVIYLICLQSNTIAQWETQNSGVSADLIDVSFVDSLNGCVIGDSTIILTTKDGGTNWIKRISPIDINNFTKVELVSSKRGFIIGEKGLILSTSNGGSNWEMIETGYNYNFSDISFTDSLNGWLSCWLETETERIGAILHTNDGGNTWEKQIEKSSNQLFNSTIFMAVDFLNDSIGWALGGDYADNFSPTQIYFTSDKGNNWDIIGNFESGPLNIIKAISLDSLWAGGITFVNSFDGGQNWNVPMHENINVFPIALSPINGLRGCLIDFNIISKESKLFSTYDGGQNWEEEFAFAEHKINDFTLVNGKSIYVVGDFGLIQKKDIITNINLSENQIEKYQLVNNYPNPFNNSTIINYSIPASQFIRLKIYNILGKEITTLIEKIQSKGSYSVLFNAAKLPSGFYFGNLQCGNFNKTITMIHLK